VTDTDDTTAGPHGPVSPDEDAQGPGAVGSEVAAVDDLSAVELPPVPEDASVDDEIAALYADAARRRERAVGEGARRGRAWWPSALAALLVAAVVCCAAWNVTGLVWRSLEPASVVTAPPEDAPPSVVPTETVEATESVTATSPVEWAEPTGPVGLSEAIAVYALPFPDAPSVEPAVIKSLKPRGRYVAITIDDGIPLDTRMLDLFEEEGVHGTAFVLGTFARSRPDLLQRMVDGGWEIANHSWDHKNLKNLSDEKLRLELSRTQEAISAVTGNQAPYLRPPGGAYDKQVEKVAASMGYRLVMWNRSLADTSSSATTNQLYRNAVSGVEPGDIILCHWGRPHTYEAMRRILPELRRRGFTVVSISELIADSGGIEALP
jgi:peptidoglycan/xylan/chitin deacetylase (PgdA/CDA1 family)